MGRVSGGSSGSSTRGEAAGPCSVEVFFPAAEFGGRDVFDVGVGLWLPPMSVPAGFLLAPVTPAPASEAPWRAVVFVDPKLPLPLPAAVASSVAWIRSSRRWCDSAAVPTPAVLAAAAALPTMLVPAIAAPSNVIIPTPPIAPLCPPPTTMPATICGRRCATTARMMHATIIIAKAAGVRDSVPVEATKSCRILDPNPDDQLHRHQADADAEDSAIVVNRHVARPAAPAKAEKDKPGVNNNPCCAKQKDHVDGDQCTHDQNDECNDDRGDYGFGLEKIYVLQRVLKHLHR